MNEVRPDIMADITDTDTGELKFANQESARGQNAPLDTDY